MAITSLDIYNDALSQLGARRLSTITDAVEEQRIITAVYDDIRDEVLSEHMWTFAQKRAALVDMTAPDVDLWVTATAYAVDDEVKYGGVFYTCLIANTSTNFAADLAAVEWETTTDWVTTTAYEIGDQVYNSGVSYACLVAHTSGTFATDLASVDWIISESLAMDEDGMSVVYYKPTDFIEISLMSDSTAIVKWEGPRILSNTTALKMVYTYKNDTPSLYTASFRKALATKIAAEICFSITNSSTKTEAMFDKYTKIVLPKAISSDSQQGTPIETLANEWENARISGAGVAPRVGQQTWHPNS